MSTTFRNDGRTSLCSDSISNSCTSLSQLVFRFYVTKTSDQFSEADVPI